MICTWTSDAIGFLFVISGDIQNAIVGDLYSLLQLNLK